MADAAGLGAALTAVLEQARLFSRGPKALGAVRAAGLDDADMADPETTASLVDRVLETARPGAKVAVQLHGYTDEIQLDRLRSAGTTVLTVTPYRWVAPSSTDRLTRLVDAVCRRELDVVTFTSAPAVEAVLKAAQDAGRLEDFVAALGSDVVAAVVGPVTAGPLRALGVEVMQPERFRMGALIRLVCDHLNQHRVLRLRAGNIRIELRGRCVDIDGRSVMLGPHALALFKALASTDSVVSRQELKGCLAEVRDDETGDEQPSPSHPSASHPSASHPSASHPGHRGSDHPRQDHTLEVALSRLRRSLGVPGLITTVVRRGYRLNATRLEAADS